MEQSSNTGGEIFRMGRTSKEQLDEQKEQKTRDSNPQRLRIHEASRKKKMGDVSTL